MVRGVGAPRWRDFQLFLLCHCARRASSVRFRPTTMRIQSGQTVLLTGASGGLGIFMARAFAKMGASLALTGYPGEALDEVRAESEKLGVKARVYALDLRVPA